MHTCARAPDVGRIPSPSRNKTFILVLFWIFLQNHISENFTAFHDDNSFSPS